MERAKGSDPVMAKYSASHNGGREMIEDRNQGSEEAQAWPVQVRWDLGGPSVWAQERLWRCDALRAGRLYQRSVFASREEAEAFAAKMQQMEPDQMFNVEAIQASAVWN
ncbi:MAG: hypothetical protein ACP5E5_08565 [Acidobacteriaceae bacterium]